MALTLGLLFCLGHNNAYAAAAACTAGLPCDTPLTANPDPLNDERGPTADGTGPNITGMPNAIKTDGDMSCDADFMNQIYGKAFLEAEREMVSANAIIHKPDSVLEYTCADQQASVVANDAAPIFSQPTGDLPGLIESLALQGITTFVDSNFDHDFLGGADAGNNSNLSASVSGGGACDTMYSVWQVAKCSDFALEAPFMTFEELIGNDIRRRPEVCGSMHQITQNIINLANNKDPAEDPADPAGHPYATVDLVQTFLDRILAAGNSGGGGAGGGGGGATPPPSCEIEEPIPTGVTVYYRQFGQDLAGRPTVIDSYEYPDKVCTNPGCYFDNRQNDDATDDRCVP
jgi:hypothetical protein